MAFFSRKNVKYLLVVFILLVVVFVSLRGAGSPVKGFILGISSPFLKTFRIFSGGIAGFFDFLGSIDELKNENEILIRENQELFSRNIQLEDMKKENDILRKELSLAPKAGFELEASFVIAQDPQGLGNYIFVDKGKNAGLGTGMPVIVSGGFLVGRVSEAYSTSSRIILAADSESAVNAEAEESGARGIVKGEYGLGLKLDMVSQAEVINEGDTVITSGLGGGIPRGLVIGKISQVGQSEDKLFQQAAVSPAVDFSGLKIVFVVKKY